MEGLTTNSSVSVSDDDKSILLKRKSAVYDRVDSEELVSWVRRVTGRLLWFAVQDFTPSFAIRDCSLPVWNNFEPCQKFSHMRLHRRRLSYNDLVASSFCRDIKNGRVADFQLTAGFHMQSPYALERSFWQRRIQTVFSIFYWLMENSICLLQLSYEYDKSNCYK